MRGVAVDTIRWLAVNCELGNDRLQQLLAELEQHPVTAEALVQSLRVELYCQELPQLDQLPQDGSLVQLVDAMLATYYSNTCSFPLDESEPPPSLGARLVERRQWLLHVLEGHSAPFDKGSTRQWLVRAVGEQIDQLRQPWRVALRPRQLWHGLRRRLRDSSFRRQDATWPAQLSPNWPVEYLGSSDDAQAKLNEN
jgi:hypothetical protein